MFVLLPQIFIQIIKHVHGDVVAEQLHENEQHSLEGCIDAILLHRESHSWPLDDLD